MSILDFYTLVVFNKLLTSFRAMFHHLVIHSTVAREAKSLHESNSSSFDEKYFYISFFIV